MPRHPVLEKVTARIVARSAPTRQAYLDRTRAMAGQRVERANISCTNLAHGVAAMPDEPRERRQARVERVTRETQIAVRIDLAGSGRSSIQTPLPFLSHIRQHKNRNWQPHFRMNQRLRKRKHPDHARGIVTCTRSR